MSIVTVKNKFQVVIPQSVRRKLGISRGDVLEAKAERGKLIYIPKMVMVLDRSDFPSADDEYTPAQRRLIDARLKAARKGPFAGPFKDGSEIAAFLKASLPKAKKSKSKSGR